MEANLGALVTANDVQKFLQRQDPEQLRQYFDEIGGRIGLVLARQLGLIVNKDHVVLAAACDYENVNFQIGPIYFNYSRENSPN